MDLGSILNTTQALSPPSLPATTGTGQVRQDVAGRSASLQEDWERRNSDIHDAGRHKRKRGETIPLSALSIRP
jgi:hypothetical protein